MGNEWHYTQNGQPAPAPISTVQLRQLAGTGQLKPDDLVWQEGMTSWVPAASVKGLFSAKSTSTDLPANAVRAARGKTDTRPGAPPTDGAVPAAPSEGMHPLLVLLWTVLTLGIFGIVYACRVGRRFAAAGRPADALGRPLGKLRHPALVLLLAGVTLGFYLIYWTYQVLQEHAAFTDQREPRPRTELALMLICPLYGIYLTLFRVPPAVQRIQAAAGLPEQRGFDPAFLLLNPLFLAVLPLVCMQQQESLNNVWLTVP
jgi:hypothetical protein